MPLDFLKNLCNFLNNRPIYFKFWLKTLIAIEKEIVEKKNMVILKKFLKINFFQILLNALVYRQTSVTFLFDTPVTNFSWFEMLTSVL